LETTQPPSPHLPQGGNTTTDDQLTSVKELADYLNVTVTTIYLWSKRGQIPAMKVGNLRRYRRSDIEEWLNEHRHPRVEHERGSR
jgi:excisionase family DNA binding protein